MKTLTAIMALLCSIQAAAQTEYKGTFYNTEYGVRMRMNLEKMDIPVPGMEDVDSCYGYVDGRLNGMWFLLKVNEKTEKKAVVRAMSERGADAQEMEIQMTEDGVSIKLIGSTQMKGVQNRKYVKLPKPMEMVRQ